MPQREVVLWPTRENYDRFAELCDDTVAETFDDFERNALATMGNLAAQGIILERVSFDPDRMAQWCRANFGKVNAHTRCCYAAFIALVD
tara:strand:- start:107 stop:373 length:267 start_codon:yes stop_codon:yes gene_type:complete